MCSFMRGFESHTTHFKRYVQQFFIEFDSQKCSRILMDNNVSCIAWLAQLVRASDC